MESYIFVSYCWRRDVDIPLTGSVFAVCFKSFGDSGCSIFRVGLVFQITKTRIGRIYTGNGRIYAETGEYMRTNTFQLDQCGLISISWFLFVKHFVWFNHVLSIPSMHGLSSPSCVAHRFDQSSIRANFSDSGKFPKLGRIFVAKPPGLKLRAGRQSRYW